MSEELSAESLAQPTREMTVSDEVMIQMIDVHKWYGQFHVLKDINLTVNKGERIVICGPSGSGKSTLIRCLNRLEEHQKLHAEFFDMLEALVHDLNLFGPSQHLADQALEVSQDWLIHHITDEDAQFVAHVRQQTR